jgi:hypothetical protein
MFQRIMLQLKINLGVVFVTPTILVINGVSA